MRSDVTDRASLVPYVRGEHFRADVSCPSLPSPVILGDAREGRNKSVPGITPVQLPECIHERSIFQVAVRVEKKDRMTESLRCSVSNRNTIVSSATSVRPSSVLW